MKYSIVIPTKGDMEVSRTIAAATSQDFGSFEVIIVDASNGKHSEDVKTAAEAGGAQYIREEDFGNSWGRNAARNIGIELSGGDKIVLLDGDCIPPEDWLVSLEETFSSGADIIDTRVEYVSNTQDCPLDRVVQNLEGEHRHLGAAMSFRKEVWDEVGGIDEGFKLFRGDSDFGIKAEEAGFRHDFLQETAVQHRPEDFTPMSFVASRASKFVEEPRFFDRHRGSELLEVPALGPVTYPKRAAFLSMLLVSTLVAFLRPLAALLPASLSLLSAAVYWRREAAKREGGLDPCLKQTALLPVLVPLAMLGKRLAIWRGALRDRVFVL